MCKVFKVISLFKGKSLNYYVNIFLWWPLLLTAWGTITGSPGLGRLASAGSMLIPVNSNPTLPVLMRVISAVATWSNICTGGQFQLTSIILIIITLNTYINYQYSSFDNTTLQDNETRVSSLVRNLRLA